MTAAKHPALAKLTCGFSGISCQARHNSCGNTAGEFVPCVKSDPIYPDHHNREDKTSTTMARGKV